VDALDFCFRLGLEFSFHSLVSTGCFYVSLACTDSLVDISFRFLFSWRMVGLEFVCLHNF